MENSQKALSNLTSVTAISSKADAKADAKQSNFIADIFDSIFGGMTIIIIIAALFGCVGLYILMKNGGLGMLFNKKQQYLQPSAYAPPTSALQSVTPLQQTSQRL